MKRMQQRRDTRSTTEISTRQQRLQCRSLTTDSPLFNPAIAALIHVINISSRNMPELYMGVEMTMRTVTFFLSFFFFLLYVT